MTNDNLQQQLKKLGHQWPTDERFVDHVMARLAVEPHLTMSPRRSRNRIVRLSYCTAAAMMVCMGLWWASGLQSTGNMLYAQILEAMKKVQSFHVVYSVQTEDADLSKVGDTWFARNKGFVVINTERTRIDDGTHFWEHVKGSDTASRTKSQGTDDLLDRALDIREELERDCHRYPAGDREIDGRVHPCFQLTFHGAVQPADQSFLDFDQRRTFLFINSESLLKRVESQENVEGEWQTRYVLTWEYDVPVDSKLFEPNFGSEVQVIDKDEAFEQLTAVKGSFHSEQREGLIYTIHQAKRFENGGIFLRTSVRGSDKTLENYPLTRREIQPGLYFTEGPATNWNASPQGSGYFRLILANANQRGVDVQWWIMVPRGQKPDWFVDKEGRVQLPLGITPMGEYGKAKHADERGVMHHISWSLALDIPPLDAMPSLSKIARQVHSEMQLLSSTAFPYLHMGNQQVNGVPHRQHSSVDKVSPSEFATATREHWLWWERGDIEFQRKHREDFIP